MAKSNRLFTPIQQLYKGVWPWNEGLKARLPEHYKRRLIEKYQTPPIPVHYRPDPEKWKSVKGSLFPVQNVPIPVIYPREADEGLWGGEGIVQGMKKKKNNPMKPRNPALWKPALTKRALHSEILDRWMEITVTLRTLDLIDEAFGFDFYILKTHEIDMRSKLGMQLKREMLRTLLKKSMYPDNPEKRDKIFDRYKQFIVPEEEIEWLGLSIEEAESKLAAMETQQAKAEIKPLKYAHAEAFIEKVKNNEVEIPEEKSWISKLSPFQDKKDQPNS